jgi:hypothetical protein
MDLVYLNKGQAIKDAKAATKRGTTTYVLYIPKNNGWSLMSEQEFAKSGLSEHVIVWVPGGRL